MERKKIMNSLLPGSICLGAILLFAPLSAIAQGAGSTSTNFEKIGMGARGVGMGESFIAVADDSSAVFWNPAGLILAKGTQFSVTHGEWLIGVSHEFFSFSQNIDQDGAFGGSIGYLGTGSFPGALEDPATGNYAGVGPDISATSFIGSVAYAQRLGNWFQGDFFKKTMIGVKATVVGQNIVNVGSAGAAFDLGAMYEVTRKKFYIGALFSNIGSSFPATVLQAGIPTTVDFSQPLRIKLGASYRLTNLLMKKDRNITALGIDMHLLDTGLKIDIGDEYRVSFGKDAVALRLGYRTGGDLGSLAGLTAGVGLAHRFDDFEIGLDYAFVPYGVLGLTHRISLNFVTGGTLLKPMAFVNVQPAFTLAQESVPLDLAFKSEDPIEHWKVTITDSKGTVVKMTEGKGSPPAKSSWDGRDKAGTLVAQGSYTATLEVTSDEDITGTSKPREVYAKWVPKKVPYHVSFYVPGDLMFDSGKDELLKKGYEAIQKAVGVIQRRYPGSRLIIAGHTDNIPLNKGAKFKDNKELSLARAKAVVAYLVAHGVDQNRLSVAGYGDTKPIAYNTTPEGRAKNRRFEVIVDGEVEGTATDLIEEGMRLFNQKNYRFALDRFLKAVESDSRNPQAYKLSGDCYLNLGGKAQAIQAYQKSLELNPQDAQLKKWLDTYAPQPGGGQLAPSTENTQPSPSSQVQPENAAQPESSAAPTSQAPATQAAPATGMPVGVE